MDNPCLKSENLQSKSLSSGHSTINGAKSIDYSNGINKVGLHQEVASVIIGLSQLKGGITLQDLNQSTQRKNKLTLISMIFFQLVSFTLIFLYAVLPARAEDILTAPVPHWVVRQDIQIQDLLTGHEYDGGMESILDDMQINYNKPKPQFYYHYIIQLHSLEAIQQNSTITIIYFPAFQNYELHHIRVWRDGKKIDMINSAKITFNSFDVVADSPRHEGAKTIQLYLPDIRREDIIDISYSLSGQNTAFADRAIGAQSMSASTKSYNSYRSYTVPNERPLNFKYFNNYKKPVITKNQQETTYEWNWKVIEKTEWESNVPVWYPQIPSIIYSDYNTWAEVDEWANKLFFIPDNKVTSLTSLVKNLIKDAKDDDSRIKAILSFMQSEIRYVGIEIGRNGYRPFKPKKVLERRYGDCKDQTVLMTKLLRIANIDAWPALVNLNGMDSTGHRNTVSSLCAGVLKSSVFRGREFSWSAMLSSSH